MLNVKESLKPFLDKRIALLIGDQQVREILVHDLKFYGLKKIKIFRSRKELFGLYSTTDPQPDLLFSDISVMGNRKLTENGLFMLKALHDLSLQLNFDLATDIVIVAKTIDKENAVECFKAGAKDILVFPTSISAFGSKLTKWMSRLSEKRTASEVDVLIKKGDECFRRGEFEEAIKHYDIILRSYGEKADVLERKGQALLASGNFEEAIACFKKSVQIKNNFARAYQGLGDVYIKLMDYENARKSYKKVMEIESDNCYAHYNIGETYRLERKWREAESVYNEGIKMSPKFVFFRIGLGETCVKTMQIDKALEAYKEAIRLKPNNAQYSERLGDICIENGLFEEAEAVLKHGLQANGGAVILFNKLGIALRKQKKYKEAISKYLQAINIDQNDPNLRYNIGKAYYENGENDKAVESFRISIQIEPSLKDAFLKDQEVSCLHKKLT